MLTDITPVLDFYNRECSGRTLPEYVAECLQCDCDLDSFIRCELVIASIERAIAEYEKANSITSVTLTKTGTYYTTPPVVPAADGDGKPASLPLCQHCGKPESEHFGYWQYCDAGYQEGRRFTLAIESQYRMLEAGEMREEEDEFQHLVNQWVPTQYWGTPVPPHMVGHYRRKIAPNEAQPGTPTP